MEISIDKDLMFEILEKYYKEQFDFFGKVSVNEFCWKQDFDLDDYLYLDMEISGSINFMGKDILAVKKINVDTIKEAFKYYLEEAGYTFVFFNYDYSKDSNGKLILNGIKVNISENNKVYKKVDENGVKD